MLEQKTPLRSPPPTIATLTPEEVAQAMYPPPGASGGSDEALQNGGIRFDIFKKLKVRVLYLSDDPLGECPWPEVEVRYVSCGHSVWELPWTTWELRRELETARQQGVPMQRVQMAHIKEANHFVCPHILNSEQNPSQFLNPAIHRLLGICQTTLSARWSATRLSCDSSISVSTCQS